MIVPEKSGESSKIYEVWFHDYESSDRLYFSCCEEETIDYYNRLISKILFLNACFYDLVSVFLDKIFKQNLQLKKDAKVYFELLHKDDTDFKKLMDEFDIIDIKLQMKLEEYLIADHKELEERTTDDIITQTAIEFRDKLKVVLVDSSSIFGLSPFRITTYNSMSLSRDFLPANYCNYDDAIVKYLSKN